MEMDWNTRAAFIDGLTPLWKCMLLDCMCATEAEGGRFAPQMAPPVVVLPDRGPPMQITLCSLFHGECKHCLR